MAKEAREEILKKKCHISFITSTGSHDLRKLRRTRSEGNLSPLMSVKHAISRYYSPAQALRAGTGWGGLRRAGRRVWDEVRGLSRTERAVLG